MGENYQEKSFWGRSGSVKKEKALLPKGGGANGKGTQEN